MPNGLSILIKLDEPIPDLGVSDVLQIEISVSKQCRPVLRRLPLGLHCLHGFNLKCQILETILKAVELPMK